LQESQREFTLERRGSIAVMCTTEAIIVPICVGASVDVVADAHEARLPAVRGREGGQLSKAITN